ncbi:MAG: Uracil DNA glycosylase superfamily protein [Betaproteobacteria bacterium ADurb.Bin341]|nr:MAG: Uracil DNA glycosylase superfamily protein [Betaproteobacteria bacterium ADurb.Bin341]
MSDLPLLTGLAPRAEADARLLILGSMPGAASLAAGAYYAHPRNQFWRLLADLLDAPLAELPYEERFPVLAGRGIALWDVIACCARAGSLDASIAADSLQVNDFKTFFAKHARIADVFFNGALAETLFRRRVLPGLACPLPHLCRLPSSSPAHAARDYATKLAVWRDALAAVLGTA